MVTFSAASAATILHVTPRRVTAMISSGRLRAYRSGNEWIIEKKDLDAAMIRKPGRPPITILEP